MARPEYDSFWYNEATIELADALDDDQQDLFECYDRDSLFCPECHIAQLKFTRKTSKRRAFLSTRQSSALDNNTHLNTCSHSFPRITKKQAQEYYRHLTDGQIKDKLDSAISAFLRNASSVTEMKTMSSPEINPVIATITESRRRVYRRLPKRSVFSIYDVDDDELNIPVLVYGTVYLSVESCPSKYGSGHYHFLCCRSNQTSRPVHKIYRASIYDEVEGDRKYYLAAVVILEKRGSSVNSKAYSSASVRFVPTA